MNPKGPSNPAAQEGGVRSPVKWIAVGILGLCLAAFAWRWSRQGASNPVTAPPAESNVVVRETPATPAPEPAPTVAATPAVEPSPAATAPGSLAPSPPAPTPVVPVDHALAGLVASLKAAAATNVALTPEAVAAWRTNFQQLVQAGAASVPALKAFLDQNVDYPFSREASQTLGYSSTRMAALDALRQIGGPESAALMEEILGKTAEPREIAALARNLEESAPGQYRDRALAAARQALATAASVKDPTDVAPLFEVFQHYGDASVIPELEKASRQWKYYAVNALANLPEGAGIPALMQMADPSSTSGNRLLALEMVAQMAPENATVKDFLVNQVKQIPPNYWAYLSGPLSGDQYFPVDSVITQYPTLQSLSDLKTTHIPYGNQNLYSVPGERSLTPEAITQRVTLVDELLRMTSEPSAVQALQQARDALVKRAARPLAGGP